MANTFEFKPGKLTVNGKEFSARYELQSADGKQPEIICIYATANGKSVKIDVPAEDPNFTAARAAFESSPAEVAEAEPVKPERVKKSRVKKAEPVKAEEPAAAEEHAAPVQAEPAAAEEQPAPVQAEPAAVPVKTFAGSEIKGNKYRILFDEATQRTRVIIAEEDRERARPVIDAAGFYYSAAMQSYNKKLTFKAYRAAVALAARLDEVFTA